MHAMVVAGEVDLLVPERVWQELDRALREPRPAAFVQTLRSCGALTRILPEVDALYGVPPRPEYHPAIEPGIPVEMDSDLAARLAPGDSVVGTQALPPDLGKRLTAADELPQTG